MTTKFRKLIIASSTLTAALEYGPGSSPDKAEAHQILSTQLVPLASDGPLVRQSFGYGSNPLPCNVHGHVTRRTFEHVSELPENPAHRQVDAIDLLNNEQLRTLARESFFSGRSVRELLETLTPDRLGGFNGILVGLTPRGLAGCLDAYGNFNH